MSVRHSYLNKFFIFFSLSSPSFISDWRQHQIYRDTSLEVGVLTAGALIPITIDCMRIMVPRDYKATNLRTIPLAIAIRFSPLPHRRRRRDHRPRQLLQKPRRRLAVESQRRRWTNNPRKILIRIPLWRSQIPSRLIGLCTSITLFHSYRFKSSRNDTKWTRINNKYVHLS